MSSGPHGAGITHWTAPEPLDDGIERTKVNTETVGTRIGIIGSCRNPHITGEIVTHSITRIDAY